MGKKRLSKPEQAPQVRYDRLSGEAKRQWEVDWLVKFLGGFDYKFPPETDLRAAVANDAALLEKYFPSKPARSEEERLRANRKSWEQYESSSHKGSTVLVEDDKKEVTEGDKGGKRFTLYGFPVTHVLRWMGANAWLVADAKRVLTKLGLEVADGTINAQVPAGRKKPGDRAYRGEPAALTPAQEQELETLLSQEG